MEFNDLKIFLHLAECKNFSKTAIRHHMSPSTLSRQIQRMEEEIGQALFLRDNRHVTLTKTGEAFLQFAQQNWLQWQHFQQQINKDKDELSGELRIFCSVTASYTHLPKILEKFRKLYPKVEIQLTTGDPALALKMVQSQQVDLAITGRPNNLSQNIIFHYLDDITLSLIVPKIACTSTKLLQKKPIRWQRIPFILPAEGSVRQRIDKWFKKNKIKSPEVYATVSGHEGIVSMVALGCGVAMVPDVVIKSSPMHNQVSTLKLNIPIEPFELGVCVQKRSLELPLIRAFWQVLE